MRLAASISFVLIGLAACGGSDDFADSIADEVGPAGESPDSGNTQTDSGNTEASSSSAESSATDSTASDTVADSTASDTADGGSTDADSSSSSSGPSDGMDSPMDGPSTHDSSSTDGVIESDDGGIGGECMTACDCMQGLGCTDTFVCAPVPDNAYCCEKEGCPNGAECQFSDGSFGVCAG